MRFRENGQTTLEFAVLMVLVIAALLAMSHYIKRGMQGRWKSSIDDMGDQYDPRLADSTMNYTVVSNSSTDVETVEDTDGFWTRRRDNTNSVTTTYGTTSVGFE